LPRARWIVPAVVLFLLVSVELARYLSASGTERTAVYALLKAQAAGDVQGMLRQLDDCEQRPRCLEQVRRNATRLNSGGRPKILLLESGSAYKLRTTTGLSRVAWTALNVKSPTYVQCITVRKRWSFVHGGEVSLRAISPRIGNEASC
jgi:hypothetical protein